MSTQQLDKKKKRVMTTTPMESPQVPTEIGEHIPVFNPNRWLWDFEAEKPKTKVAPPGGRVRRRPTNQMMMWNLVSSFLDFLFVGIFSFLFLWGIGHIFDSSVRNTMANLWSISPAGTFLLFYSFLWVYHVATPALFSHTPGQWACQITRAPSEISFVWILKATFRLFILFLTGFIILPLFSWASGTDLEGSLSGLRLQETQN